MPRLARSRTRWSTRAHECVTHAHLYAAPQRSASNGYPSSLLRQCPGARCAVSPPISSPPLASMNLAWPCLTVQSPYKSPSSLFISALPGLLIGLMQPLPPLLSLESDFDTVLTKERKSQEKSHPAASPYALVWKPDTASSTSARTGAGAGMSGRGRSGRSYLRSPAGRSRRSAHQAPDPMLHVGCPSICIAAGPLASVSVPGGHHIMTGNSPSKPSTVVFAFSNSTNPILL